MLEMLKTLCFDFKLLAALTDHPLPSYKVQSFNLCWNICKTWAINCIIICTWCDFTKSGKLAIYYFQKIHSCTEYWEYFFKIKICSSFMDYVLLMTWSAILITSSWLWQHFLLKLVEFTSWKYTITLHKIIIILKTHFCCINKSVQWHCNLCVGLLNVFTSTFIW